MRTFALLMLVSSAAFAGEPEAEAEERPPHLSLGAGLGGAGLYTTVNGEGEFSRSIYKTPTRYTATGLVIAFENVLSLDVLLGRWFIIGFRFYGGPSSGFSGGAGALLAVHLGKFYIGPAADFVYVGFDGASGTVTGLEGKSYGKAELNHNGLGALVGGRLGFMLPFTRHFGLGLEAHGLYKLWQATAGGDAFFGNERGSEHLLNQTWGLLKVGLTIQARWFF